MFTTIPKIIHSLHSAAFILSDFPIKVKNAIAPLWRLVSSRHQPKAKPLAIRPIRPRKERKVLHAHCWCISRHLSALPERRHRGRKTTSFFANVAGPSDSVGSRGKKKIRIVEGHTARGQ